MGMALLRDRWPAVVAAADLRKMLTEVVKEKPRRNGKIRIRPKDEHPTTDAGQTKTTGKTMAKCSHRQTPMAEAAAVTQGATLGGP